MTSRERLHKLVDELSEAEAGVALELIASWRKGEYMPGDIVDEWGNLSAMTRAAGMDMLRRLDEEEIAEHGETIADAWGYESPK
jgi:hypothetical protein